MHNAISLPSVVYDVTNSWITHIKCVIVARKRIDELGEDNLAELDNTENNRFSAGTKRYVAT